MGELNPPNADEKVDNSHKHVVALLREELHKLEYTYGRETRLRPPEKLLRIGALPRAVRERLKYLTEQKENMEADLKNITSDRNALADRRTQEEIGEYLNDYDAFCELIRKKIFKVTELRKNNSNIIRLIAELCAEINRRNSLLREETDKYATQNGSLEGRIHWAQLCLNRVTSDNNQLMREMNDNLTQRKVLYEIFRKQNKVYMKLKKKLAHTATAGCHIFKALKFGQNKIDTKMAKHNQKYEQFQITVQDLYRMVEEKMEMQVYFDKLKLSREEVDSSGRCLRRLSKLEKQYKTVKSETKYLKRGYARLLKASQPCKNLQEVSVMYATLDKENFQLVVDVVEVDDGITKLSKTNHELVKSMDAYYETLPGVRAESLSHEQELKQIKNSFLTTVEDLEQHSSMVDLAKHCLDLILPGLQDTFEAMAGDSDPLALFLGAKKGFSNQSIDVCLNLMEHRLNDLLYEKEYYATWKARSQEGVDTQLPELIYGFPASAGGIITPDVHLASNSSEIREEIQDILQQLDKLEPILEDDARHEAQGKAWKQNEKKRDAMKLALYKQEQSVKELSKPKKQPSKSNSRVGLSNPPSTKASNSSLKASSSRPTSATSLKK